MIVISGSNAVNWTEERIDLLVKLWGEGKSAAQISTEIGGVSRNAVIGKVHRLGIAVRRSDETPVDERLRDGAREGARRIRSTAVRPAERRRAPIDPPAPIRRIGGMVAKRMRPRERKLTPPGIMDLSESTCRWPIGDPAVPGFHFCGHYPIAGRPYCREHMLAAYMPATRNGPERILRQLEKRGHR